MLTNFYAKLLGLWILLAVLALALHRDATIAIVNAIFADAALGFVTGAFTLLIGLAIVLSHNRWSGGTLPILVTCYGWVATIKGLSFLFLVPPAEARLFAALRFERYFYVYLAVSLALGVYLTYGGFTRRASEAKPPT
ncbi:MAG: hypothetical protein JO113_09315 [Candidatus Eremiobacteraeota bacterium]|nr:hypothetical protein [Candidatus Eremiobacteraeota bacterium]